MPAQVKHVHDGDQADQVVHQNEEEQAQEQWQPTLRRARAQNGLDHFVAEPANHGFHKLAQAALGEIPRVALTRLSGGDAFRNQQQQSHRDEATEGQRHHVHREDWSILRAHQQHILDVRLGVVLGSS